MSICERLAALGISWTWAGNWLTAKKDECKICGISRSTHTSKEVAGHSFKEE